MLDNGDITPKQFRWAVASSDLRLRPGELYSDDPRAVLLRLRPRRADRSLRREHRSLGRAQGLHDDQPALPARRGDLDPGDARRARRSGVGGRLDQPRQRRHPRDDVGDPGPKGLPVQPCRTGSAAGRVHLQDLRAGDRGDEEDRSRRRRPTSRRRSTISRTRTCPAWEVSTYDHSYSGWTSVESATIRSDNSVFAQLTVDVGPENVAATARRMGVRTPLLPCLRSGSAPSPSLPSISPPGTRRSPAAACTRGRWRFAR